MKHIFLRTLETTVKKVSIVIALIIGIGIGIVLNKTVFTKTGQAYNECLNNLLMMQHLMVFFGIDGIMLMCFTAGSSSGLIASETHEGTFRLLAAKPNSRATILTAKILGNITGLTVLMLLSLLSYYSTIVITAQIDGNLIRELIRYLPSYILYGLLIIFMFSSISTLLSCACKKKITALLPVLVVMIVAMGFFPIMRIVRELTNSTDNSVLNIVDINYHFALLFKQCTSFVGKIQGSQIMGYLTNLFSQQKLDLDIVRDASATAKWLENKSLSAPIVTLVYLLVAIGCYYWSYIIINKKDI